MKHTSPSRLALIAMAAFALVVASPVAAAQDHWFHVRVEEGGSNPTEVTVNLPLSLIEAAMEVIPDEISSEVHVELNEAGFSVEQLRELWQEVRNSPDATFVTVKSQDETVEVSKSGDFFIAKTTEGGAHGAQVDVKFPLEVVDALFSGPTNQLDIAAAIRVLAQYEGNVVTVHDDETSVRIWVDDKNQVE